MGISKATVRDIELAPRATVSSSDFIILFCEFSLEPETPKWCNKKGERAYVMYIENKGHIPINMQVCFIFLYVHPTRGGQELGE